MANFKMAISWLDENKEVISNLCDNGCRVKLVDGKYVFYNLDGAKHDVQRFIAREVDYDGWEIYEEPATELTPASKTLYDEKHLHNIYGDGSFKDYSVKLEDVKEALKEWKEQVLEEYGFEHELLIELRKIVGEELID